MTITTEEYLAAREHVLDGCSTEREREAGLLALADWTLARLAERAS